MAEVNFSVWGIQFPHVFEPYNEGTYIEAARWGAEGYGAAKYHRPRWSLRFPAEQLPEGIRAYCSPLPLTRGTVAPLYASTHSGYSPLLIPIDGEGRSALGEHRALRQDAADCNISLDRLLRDGAAEIAVEPYDFQGRKTGLSLIAIRFDVAALRRRFEQLLRESMRNGEDEDGPPIVGPEF